MICGIGRSGSGRIPIDAGELFPSGALDSEKPDRQDVTLSCTCADCRELRTFMLDPMEQIRRFCVRLDRRQHLQQVIHEHRLDMAHTTERSGSPQTLVCSKNRRSYTRRCDQYRKDVAALDVLIELAAAAGVAPKWLKRIRAARQLAARWSPA